MSLSRNSVKKPMEESHTLFEKVIGNTLIGEKIVSYLSVEECKIVCLASRVLHGMVISSSSFSKRIVLRLITNNQLNTNNKMKNLRLSSWLWPSVEFDTTLSSQILQFLQNNAAVLTNITTLRLHQCCTESVQEQDRTRALLNMILGNCYRLVDIQIGLGLLITHNLTLILQLALVKRIQALEIFSDDYHLSYINSSRSSIAAETLRFFHGGKLKKISVHLQPGFNALNAELFQIIVSNAETLTSLTLDNFGQCGVDLQSPINLPKLRFLSLHKVHGQGVDVLIKDQLLLENITIQFATPCPPTFLNCLKTVRGNLVSLGITCPDFQPGMDWSWLGNCGKLKKFVVIQERLSDYVIYGSLNGPRGLSFLPWLPPSLTKLTLKGLQHFWKPANAENWNESNVSESDMISFLSRFPRMTHLELSRCSEAVSDVVLQTVLKTMSKLQVLKFSHGSCSDFGVTGIQNGELVGVSLTHLKDLTRLEIKSCPGISTAALLSSLRHASFRTLKFGWSSKMTAAQVEQLVVQNPFLNNLSLQVKDEKEIEELVTKLNTIRVWDKLNFW